MRGSAVVQGYFLNGPRSVTRLLAPTVLNCGTAPGQPLPPAVRQKLEASFGTSFADVRIHIGPQPGSIGAAAFTHGSHIHFAPGQYDPNSARGQQILGHELAHVVQQRTGRVRNPFGSGIALVHDQAMDAEAHQIAQRAAGRQQPVQRKPATPPQGQGQITPGARPAAGVIQGRFEHGLHAVARSCRRAGTIQPKVRGAALELPPGMLNLNASRGVPLPATVQRAMEKEFRTSFSGVRIHVGPEAASIGAVAFTKGSDIYFAPGRYEPFTPRGQQLIGHELTHVVQQRTGRVRNPFGSSIAVIADRALEAEADFKGLSAAASAVQAKMAAQGVTPAQMMATAWQSESFWHSMGLARTTPIQCAGLLDYLGKTLVNLGSWLWSLTFVNIYRSIPNLIAHILSAPVKLLLWIWDGIKSAIFGGNLTFRQWLVEGIRGGAAWVGRLFTKILDLVGIGELLNFFVQLVKTSSRPLNGGEMGAAQIAWGNSIPYWKVRVDTTPGGQTITALYNWIIQLTGGAAGNMIAISAFHSIEINPTESGNFNNIVHELGHVKQQEAVGSQYMAESMHAAMAGAGYDYDAQTLDGNHLRDYNREQQCRIMEHYFGVQTIGNGANPGGTFLAWAQQYRGLIAAVIPSINAVNFAAALNAYVLAHPLLMAPSPRNVALALYQPKATEFRNGSV